MSSETAKLPADVRDFIYHVTLHLHSHRSTTPEQKDRMFQEGYKLYAKYDVEGERNREADAAAARWKQETRT